MRIDCSISTVKCQRIFSPYSMKISQNRKIFPFYPSMKTSFISLKISLDKRPSAYYNSRVILKFRRSIMGKYCHRTFSRKEKFRAKARYIAWYPILRRKVFCAVFQKTRDGAGCINTTKCPTAAVICT